MFTKKSLIVGIVLVMSVLCAGTMGAFASSVTTTTPQHYTANPYLSDGIAAIPSANDNEMLKPQDIQRYLESQGFIAGATIDGNAPTIQTLKLTNLDELRKRANLIIPGLAGNKQAYYTRLKGPFSLRRDLPLPIISTLLPSQNNMITLGRISLLNELSGLGNLATLSNLLTTAGSGRLNNLPVLSDLTGGDLFNNLQEHINEGTPESARPSGTSVKPDLESVYEVFDAFNGNLLAWG